MQQLLFDTIEQQQKWKNFELYDKEHPEVWIEFKRITLGLIYSGIKHYGAKAIFEIIRYHRTVLKKGYDKYKVNNNYTSEYARKFAMCYPQYSNFFEFRKSLSDAKYCMEAGNESYRNRHRKKRGSSPDERASGDC